MHGVNGPKYSDIPEIKDTHTQKPITCVRASDIHHLRGMVSMAANRFTDSHNESVRFKTTYANFDSLSCKNTDLCCYLNSCKSKYINIILN